MKSIFQLFKFKLLVTGLLLGLFINLNAQTLTDEAATITWPFNLGTASQTATYSSGDESYFKPDYFEKGSNYSYYPTRTGSNPTVTYTSFKNTSGSTSSGLTAANLISFHVTPVTGLTFTPTNITFDCQRFGTDGGQLDIYYKASDGTSTLIAATVKPARDGNATSEAADVNTFNMDISGLGIGASDDDSSLEIYITTLGSAKDIGLANIVISGNLNGTVSNVTQYTLASAVSPASSGSIATSPVGSVFDENTEITLTASQNFGYSFSHWADASEQILSSENPYTFNITENTTVTAVFNTINTYSLELLISGGAASYMVSPAPAGTMVSTDRMYEAGDVVTITAANNPGYTFSSWSTGETTPNLTITMDENKSITANYTAGDVLVGWDFYKSGNNSRVADFASANNTSKALIMRNAAGTVKSWLDKSQVAAGGYEGKPAAVNWQLLTDQYYYQFSIDATGFENIQVSSEMLYNFNAYSVQNCEYSLDGTSFTSIGTITMSTAKEWYSTTFTLPADANGQSTVYIRFIPDYTSSVIGAAGNDGTSITNIFVIASNEVVWNGTAWSNTTGPDAGDDALITGDFTGDITCRNLTVNSGASVTITGLLDVKGDLENNGMITIESGATLLTYADNSISGNITINRSTRYADGKYSFVGTPINTNPNTIGSSLGSVVYKYNETTAYGDDGLARWESAADDQLAVGKGYAQAFQKDLSFIGTPNSGTINITGTYTQDAVDANEGWNLISNPYPAAINVLEFLSDNTNLSGSIYLWDDNGSDQQRGDNSDYIVANAAGITQNSTAGNGSSFNGHIASCQGFFVQLMDGASKNITFSENHRSAQNNDGNFYRTTSEISQRIRINLTDANGLFKQALIAVTEDASNSQLNRIYDAKVFNLNAPNAIYTIKANNHLAIQSINSFNHILDLGMNIETTGTYTLSADLTEFNGSIFLVDNFTGEEFDLSKGAYQFTSSNGKFADRFTLKSAASILGTNPAGSFFVYVSDRTLNIKNANSTQDKSYVIYDMAGQTLFNRTLKSEENIDLSSLRKGVYIISDGKSSIKFTLK